MQNSITLPNGNTPKTLKDALMFPHARLSNEYRWLVMDSNGMFGVYERQPYSKQVKVILETDSETEAVAALIGGEGES